MNIWEIIQKHFLRVIMYGLIILTMGFIGYSAFLKPTNTTNIADGGKVINVYDPPKQPLFSLGCANLEFALAWKKSHNIQYQNAPLKNN